MHQLIRTPCPDISAPASIGELEAAESVLLLAMRWWTRDRQDGEDPWARLQTAFNRAGIPAATAIMSPLLEIMGNTARRPVDILRPRRTCLSTDEQCLLLAAGLAQIGAGTLATAELRANLLHPAGARIVAGLLEELGELLGDAGFLFRVRTVH